jgi:hypothetical protein
MQQQPAQPRPHAGGGDAGPQVAHALRRNAATTAAGQELAARLPWHVKLWARTRSAALLAAIMAMFWVRCDVNARPCAARIEGAVLRRRHAFAARLC